MEGKRSGRRARREEQTGATEEKMGGRKREGGEISAVEGERDVGLIIRIRNVDGRG